MTFSKSYLKAQFAQNRFFRKIMSVEHAFLILPINTPTPFGANLFLVTWTFYMK